MWVPPKGPGITSLQEGLPSVQQNEGPMQSREETRAGDGTFGHRMALRHCWTRYPRQVIRGGADPGQSGMNP